MKKLFLVFLICVTALCSASCETEKELVPFDGFRAIFLDTGKSDCILIRMDDKVIMCDTADDDDYMKITSVMKSNGIDKIDCMILTHFDKDHIGSSGALIRNFDVGTVYAPEASANSDEYKKLTSALTLRNMELTYLTENTEFATENGAVRIYAPFEESYDDDNSYSLITEIEYKGSVMLLTGDATKQRLSEFLSAETADGYDVIKLPHHGEYTKSLLALLSRAQAKYGIVTCDESKSTVEGKLEKAAAQYELELLFTFDGDIIFEHDGEAFVKR